MKRFIAELYISKPCQEQQVFNCQGLRTMPHTNRDAGLEIVGSGLVGSEWAKKFGSEPSEPYLVWVLAKKSYKNFKK